MEVTFVLDRVSAPRWLDDAEEAAAELETGEQLEWGYAIPWMYRALASPSSHLPFPKVPTDDSHDVALAYWSALMHLLFYSFGWVRPDRGLQSWLDAGNPTDDVRLHMLREVWDADGQLDWFRAWLADSPGLIDMSPFLDLTGHRVDDSPPDSDQAWIRRAFREAESSKVSAPIGGGLDPLHLSYHCGGPLREVPDRGSMTRLTLADRRAVLMLDSMAGWYRNLTVRGAALPDIGDRSWRVDVVVRPVGVLGTFRRSRETGLWFAGRHSLHVQGV